MAYEESIRSITLNGDASVASATGYAGSTGDDSGHQYKAVKVTGSHQCGLASAATDAVVGILQNKPQVTGHAATVAIRGVSKVRVANAIAAGSIVYLAADGRGTATGTPGTTMRLGTALTASAAANELIPVLLNLGIAA